MKLYPAIDLRGGQAVRLYQGDYDQMTWLGRGPQENYADRKSGYLIGKYSASVWEQYHPYVRAQETLQVALCLDAIPNR